MNKLIRLIAIMSFFVAPTITSYSSWAATAAMENGEADQELDRLLGALSLFKVSPPGRPVEFSLKDLSGDEIRISDFRGKIVFLNFWTTWCPYCRVEMPSMEKLHKKMKDKEFVIVVVDLQESVSAVKVFFKRHKLSFTSLLDSKGAVGVQFGVKSIPTSFILDKSGRVIAKVTGPREWNSKQSIALFEYLVEH